MTSCQTGVESATLAIRLMPMTIVVTPCQLYGDR